MLVACWTNFTIRAINIFLYIIIKFMETTTLCISVGVFILELPFDIINNNLTN